MAEVHTVNFSALGAEQAVGRPLGDLQVQKLSIVSLVRRRKRKSSFHLISKYECLTDVQRYL